MRAWKLPVKSLVKEPQKKKKKVEICHTIADVPNDTSFEAVFRNVFLGLLYKMRKL